MILRPYRKEVCTHCFLYDRGREWKIRDLAVGATFCSPDCEVDWRRHNDDICLEAFRASETFVKASMKKRSKHAAEPDGPQQLITISSIDGDKVSVGWSNTKRLGESIIRSRESDKPSKTNRAILRNTCDLAPDPDILTYTVSGVLAAYKARNSIPTEHLNTDTASGLLPSLFQLAIDPHVFITTPTTMSPLEDYTSSYLVLLAILPSSLLPYITTDLITNLASRASHNAFSIRPEGTTDGNQSGEFLGWGVWPEASFFNHSCRPNVSKERKGRIWEFRIGSEEGVRGVENRQQLCITYLGGDERDLDVVERRKRLREQWGFTCQCDRCVEESGERGT